MSEILQEITREQCIEWLEKQCERNSYEVPMFWYESILAQLRASMLSAAERESIGVGANVLRQRGTTYSLKFATTLRKLAERMK